MAVNKERLEEFLAHTQEDAAEEIDWEEEKQQFLKALEDLYAQVNSYLSNYPEVTLEQTAVSIEEEDIGRYEAPALILRMGRHKVELLPVGTNLWGAKGRVDMTGQAGRVRLVLVDRDATEPRVEVQIHLQGQAQSASPTKTIDSWEWKIATPPPRIRYETLESERFYQALLEVVNG